MWPAIYSPRQGPALGVNRADERLSIIFRDPRANLLKNIWSGALKLKTDTRSITEQKTLCESLMMYLPPSQAMDPFNIDVEV